MEAELATLRARVSELELSSGERRVLEEATERQRELLELIVENLGDGVVVADEHGKFVLFNPTAERILGIGVTDAPPKRWTEVYGAFRPDRVTPFPWNEMPLVRGLSGEETRDVEMFIRHFGRPEGVFISVTAFPLKRKDTVIGAVAVFRDITQHKQVAETERLRELALQQRKQRARVEVELERVRDELVRQTRFSAIGEVAAGIAHDLRNPLGAIRNSCYYLSRRIPSDRGDWDKHLAIIEQSLRSADWIIDNLLNMSHERAASKESVDLARAVQAAFEPLRSDDGIELELRLSHNPFVAHADPRQLRRLLGNLLTNAAQAMQGRGRILVDARHEQGSDLISVSDEGSGIPSELHQRIFEPLFTTRAQGTGLGLSICRQIAERHGGTIELVQADESGSTFVVRLPREGSSAETP